MCRSFVSENPKYRMSIMDIQVLERLGEGQYGVVTKVLYKPTDTIMALKVRSVAPGRALPTGTVCELVS